MRKTVRDWFLKMRRVAEVHARSLLVFTVVFVVQVIIAIQDATTKISIESISSQKRSKIQTVGAKKEQRCNVWYTYTFM